MSTKAPRPDAPPPAGLRRWLRRPNLRGKVTWLLLALSLGPLMLAGIITVNRAVEQGKRSVRARHAQAVRMTASAVGALIDRAGDELRGVARRFPLASFDPERLGAILDQGLPPPLAPLPQWSDLDELVRVNAHYSGAMLALADGRLVWSAPHHNLDPPPRLTGIAGFDQAQPGATLFGVLPPLTGARRPRPMRVQPVYGPQGGAPVAWLGLVLEPGALADLLVRGGSLGREGAPRLFIVDSAQQIVAHTDPEQVGQPAPAFLRSPELSRKATAELSHRTGTRVVAREGVPNTAWQVVLAVPAATAYREVSVLIWILTAVIGLTLAFVLLFADFLANKLLAPIRALEEGARILGGGALDYRLDLSRHRRDELGRLAAAFNQMGENLLANRNELRAYGRSLEAANAELDALVYGITHDLKKSLRSIDAFATFLEEDFGGVLAQEGLELVHSISGKVGRINELADDLIGLVQQERERGDASRFELGELVEEVRARVALHRPGACVVEGPLPALHADRPQIGLLLEQLIENGLTFNRSPQPRVVLRAVDDGPDWRIEVEDNGIGIDPRYRAHVFELFARLNQPDEFPGSGTGLSIARRIVEEHRGQISIEAAPGQGTRFLVRLPKEPMLMTRPGMRLDELA